MSAPTVDENLVAIRRLLDGWRAEMGPAADRIPRVEVAGVPDPNTPRPSLTLIQGGGEPHAGETAFERLRRVHARVIQGGRDGE